MPVSNWVAILDSLSNTCRDQDAISSNQSLRVLSNLVAAGAIHSNGLSDDIIRELLVFTGIAVSLKSSEYNDLMAKVYISGNFI